MNMNVTYTDPKTKRKHIPADFEITDWTSLEPYYEGLLNREISSVESLEAFLLEANELQAIVAEDRAWRHINMTRNTKDEELVGRFQFFIQEIMPKLSIYGDKLNRKIVDSPYFDQLDEKAYRTFKRGLRKELEMFREENVPLHAEAQTLAQQFSAITGGMMVEIDGERLTPQQAAKYLEKADRSVRERVWRNISNIRLEAREQLHKLFDQLIEIRTRIANNAGYDTYTQFKFDQMQRFDYSPEDTLAFHDAVEKVITPVYQELMLERKEVLGLDSLRPWDTEVDIFGNTPLKPFDTGEQLISNTIDILADLKPELGKMIGLMQEIGFLDVDSREGKAPGGYNYPLMESGVPFIFMNAAGSHRDVITLLHESGHAVHSFLTRDIPLNVLKHTPSEVAELASMSMELIALDQYHHFYPEQQEAIRAKKSQLVRCILIFPWIATVDAFQQWVYDHPEHTHEEREKEWVKLYERFHGHSMDWSGLEQMLALLWQKQIHIFEYPFYYIEYAIAQLGALAVWQNTQNGFEKGMKQYLDALKLGYTKTIPEIYETAGIRFDFSADYMKEQLDFCMDEYRKLSK